MSPNYKHCAGCTDKIEKLKLGNPIQCHSTGAGIPLCSHLKLHTNTNYIQSGRSPISVILYLWL